MSLSCARFSVFSTTPAENMLHKLFATKLMSIKCLSECDDDDDGTTTTTATNNSHQPLYDLIAFSEISPVSMVTDAQRCSINVKEQASEREATHRT